MAQNTRGRWARIGLVAAAWAALSGGLRAQCMQWTELSVSNPPPASYDVWRAEMVYDKALHAAVLLVDYHPSYPNRVLVYSLTGTNWSLFNPFVPAPTSVHGACYHDQRGSVLAWCSGNELWEWNGALWSRITHPGPWPNGSYGTLMTYDPARQRVILVSPAEPLDQTWEWTGSAWEQGPAFGPTGLGKLCFDTFRNVAFMFGEYSLYESYWEYTPGASAAQGSWVEVIESVPYVAGEGEALVYDVYHRQIIGMGGMFWSGALYSYNPRYWDVTGPTWAQLLPPGSVQLPSDKRRSHSAMCFDTDTGQLIMFGGRRHEFPGVGTIWHFFNDTWALNRNDPGLVVDLPPSKSWCAGQNGVLSVSVAGSAEVQWWKNNQPIPGATSTILVVSPVTGASAGVYECEVGNSCGAIWSRPCTVSVTVAPAITSQPIGDDCCPGQDVLIVGPGVTGTNPEIKLQQEYGGFWQNVPYQYNPVGNFYILPYAQHAHTGWYRFEAGNSCGTVYSNQFHVQVGVSFTQQPVSAAYQPCETVVFTVGAQGVGGLSYVWRRDGVPLIDDGRITGVATANLTINGMRYEDEGTYDCLVTDSCETRGTGGADLDMESPPQWVHRTTLGPVRRVPFSTDMVYDAARGVCVLYGGTAATSPVAMNYADDTWEWDGIEWTRRFPAHSPGLRADHEMVYDSVRNRVLLFGGHTPTAWPGSSEVWEYDGNDWTLMTTSPFGPPVASQGDAVFDPVRGKLIVLTDLPGGPAPSNRTWEFDPGTLVWLQAYGGTGAYWYHSPLVYDAAMGAVLGMTQPGDTWRYTGTGWDIVPNAPPPRYYPVVEFDAFRLRPTMFGCCRNEPNYSYYHNDTWAFDGVEWDLILPEFQPNAADRLWPAAMAFDSKRNAMVVVGNTFNNFAGLNPIDTWEYRYVDKVVFDRQPQDQPLVVGANAQLIVHAAGAGTLTYQWRKGAAPLSNGPTPGGSVVSGAQTNTLTISGLTAADAGEYRCLVSNACGSLLSNAAQLGSTCYPDCNGNGTLTVADFGCFQTAFISSNPYADCNQSGTLTVADFGCFQTQFVVGCP